MTELETEPGTGTEPGTEIEKEFYNTVRAFPHLAGAVGYGVQEPEGAEIMVAATEYATTEGGLAEFVKAGEPETRAAVTAVTPARTRRPAGKRQRTRATATPPPTGDDAA
jgi:hypothetical protein